MKAFVQCIQALLALFICIPFASAQTTLTVQPGQPVLDGIITPGEWTSAQLITTRGVTLQAMADGDYLYMAASWADPTQNAKRNRLTFDGSQWTKSENEDRIAFLFDMGQTGADGANCQAFCHFPGMSTNGGVVDVWNWQASRSNPMGYSEDTYWDASGQHVDAGVSAVLVNDLNSQNLPQFMASSDPGAIKDFLVENAAARDAFDPFGALNTPLVEEAVAFNAATPFSANNYIPGYIHRIPSGDIADVRAAGRYNNGTWTVEFKRGFEGGEHDFTVTPGGSVRFVHEVFNNQGADHAIDATPIDGTTYTLDFSAITATGIEPLDETLPSTFVLHQNYPNPFNPETTITFNIPRESHATLTVSNVIGQVVAVPVDQMISPGNYRVNIQAKDLPSGIYLYTLTTDYASLSRQMLLVK